MKIEYDVSLIKIMSLFDSLTHTDLKDCFESNETMYFVVPAGLVGKAVGQGGKNARRLEQLLKKRVKILEFNEDPFEFLHNLAYPVKMEKVSLENDVLTVRPSESKGRSMLIGRNAINLRATEKILQRYFPIKEIRVE